ncbi:MAG: hypothetical protein JJ911_01340 [Rhizobiaceae bacterium]|nr:hypothetical protein [Rhizobiaceae bacterium]
MAVRSFAAVVFVLSGLPWLSAAESDPAPSLGMTRAAFFVKINDMYPRLELPALDCGRPLVIKHCRSGDESPVQVFAAETYRSIASMRDFAFGAEGLLYSAGAVFDPTNEVGDFAVFHILCAAMLRALEVEDTETGAVDLVAAGIEQAAAELTKGDGTWVLETARAIVVVSVTGPMRVRFEVTAQWGSLSIN